MTQRLNGNGAAALVASFTGAPRNSPLPATITSIVSTGHLCIGEPGATPGGSSSAGGGKNSIVGNGLTRASKQRLACVLKQQITSALR